MPTRPSRPSFGPNTANGVPPPPPTGSSGVQPPPRIVQGPNVQVQPMSHVVMAAQQPQQPTRIFGLGSGGVGDASRRDMPWTVPFGSLRLPARWGGHRVPIRLHLLILAMPLLASLTTLARGDGGLAFLIVLLSTGPLGVLMVLVHECGHIAEAARHGCTPSHILLWPLGGLAVIASCGSSHRQMALIAGAGPATHVPMILFWLGLLASTSHLTLSTNGLSL